MRRYPTNRYIGVNAHLNSYLQQAFGMWSNYHAELIIHIRRKLDEILPSNYYALSEQGLQLNFVQDDEIERRTSRPDINILQSRPSQNPVKQEQTKPAISIPFKEVEELDIEEALPRVGIYETSLDNSQGKLITTIEVLSPANKPQGSNYPNYLEKRAKQLHAGISLVEIDLLHINPPILSLIPSYPRRQANAVPYGVLVSIPQPSFEAGQTDWYHIPVDAPLTNLPLPLDKNETISLDLQEVYNELFANVRFYHQHVDYDSLPVNFSAYSPEDQARIQTMLEAIRAEA